MRHKGLFLLYSDINTKEPDGIERKILSQMSLFEKSGIDMEYTILERNRWTKWAYKDEYSKVDFIYFRKGTIVDRRFINFFSKIKENGSPLIFMEIPTYPYEGEYGQGIIPKVSLAIDHYYRKKLSRCIDRIVVTGDCSEDFLWGVKTINIVNGIDFSTIKKREFKPHDGIINISCIAKFSPWHGYERLIRGLADYYKQNPVKEVRLLMVGDGVEKPYYEKLVEDLDLSKYVSFLGRLTGEKLDNIYDITDIGACSFGRYKSGINVIGDLKSREFMAKGIPMICGCEIDVLQKKRNKYALFFKNDDSVIDINSITDWYIGLMSVEDENAITAQIRSFSKGLIDYSVTFCQVVRETVDSL